MDAICVTRSDLVGKSKSDTLVMETLIRANALNRTGDVNYNESGIKDGVGFEESNTGRRAHFLGTICDVISLLE